MIRRLQVGNKLQAKYSDPWDKVTKDKIYEVVEVANYHDRTLFHIINDEGDLTFPIGASFKLVGDEMKGEIK